MRFSIVGAAFAALLCSVTPGATAQQIPSPADAQRALMQNPALADSIRARLQQSGLSPQEIRDRLRAAGYPESMLDAYLGAEGAGQAALAPVDQQLSAIEALGLEPVTLYGQMLPTDTGFVSRRAEALRAESIAVGNYVFGVDVFRRSKTQFLPLLSGPVPADYRLGPNDRLALILTGQVERAYPLQVTRDGFILIPQVGQVFVARLTLEQLRDLLYTELNRVYSGVRRGPTATTRFDITITNVRANQVFVVGEVHQPGAYQISSLGTVLTAIYAAGGVADRASLRRIEVRRAGTPVATLDLYAYLLQGDTRNDIRLETGDVVFVPVHDTRVQVTGAVRRPAYYDLQTGGTLGDVIQLAGGFRADAALRRITIHRILSVAARGPGPVTRTVVDVPLGGGGALASGDHRSGSTPPDSGVNLLTVPVIPLQDGDSVVVDPVPSVTDAYYVAIAGMVNKPGMYPWAPGMTLRDLVLLARGPRIGAYLNNAEITRLPQTSVPGKLADTIHVPLDSTYLFERDSAGRYAGPPGPAVPDSGAREVLLQPYDNVLVLKQPDFNLQRTVVVTGEVRFPGTYSLLSKTDRLADVIERSGGLTPEAYADGIRFVRALSEVGRINVDLLDAIKNRSSRSNLLLQAGDSIDIPEYQPSVRVSGAVNSTLSVLWQKGKGLDYYLGAAGGLTARADGGRVSVRYANGETRTRRRTFLFQFDPTPKPGSEVFVPQKEEARASSAPAVLSAVAAIIGSLVTVAVVLITQP
jgi:protein involved in polysaccharide export with SLBB domain